MVADTFERSFSTALVDGDGSNSGNNDGTGTAVLLFVGALVMIGVLAGAVLLTREREEEVERDIFNYCPVCDGELEGDENCCPHCSFNLRKLALNSTTIMSVASPSLTSWRIAHTVVLNKTFPPSLNVVYGAFARYQRKSNS